MAVAAGDSFSLALKADGTVVGWGYNGYGQISIPAGLNKVTAIAAGNNQSLALRADGTVVSWGAEDLPVPPDLRNVIALEAGQDHNLVLKSDGKVVAWGSGNPFGELDVPLGLSNVVAISAGASHSLALKADGTLVTWGDNTYGQRDIPFGLSNVVAVAGGMGHTLAIPSLDPSDPKPFIIGPKFLLGYHGNNFYHRILAKNRPASFGAAGLPSGVTVNPATGLVSGAPAVTGTFPVTLLATNQFGVDEYPVTIIINGPPTITIQPASQTVIAGQNVSLAAGVDGTPPLSYQWMFHGTNIAGAPNTFLSLNNVQLAQAGGYSVRVSNDAGSVTSAPVALTVELPITVATLAGGGTQGGMGPGRMRHSALRRAWRWIVRATCMGLNRNATRSGKHPGGGWEGFLGFGGGGGAGGGGRAGGGVFFGRRGGGQRGQRLCGGLWQPHDPENDARREW